MLIKITFFCKTVFCLIRKNTKDRLLLHEELVNDDDAVVVVVAVVIT
jgi:hypothetical protein